VPLGLSQVEPAEAIGIPTPIDRKTRFLSAWGKKI